MIQAIGYAAKHSFSSLKPFEFEREEPRPNDVQIEVLDFCAEHGIGPDIQLIDIKDINDAYEKVENGDVRFRFVIDMSTLKQQ